MVRDWLAQRGHQQAGRQAAARDWLGRLAQSKYQLGSERERQYTHGWQCGWTETLDHGVGSHVGLGQQVC